MPEYKHRQDDYERGRYRDRVQDRDRAQMRERPPEPRSCPYKTQRTAYGNGRRDAKNGGNGRNGGNDNMPPPTLMGQMKLIVPALKKFNKSIEGLFPNNADEIAYKLVKITKPAIIVCYALVAVGILASRLQILWSVGYLWGIASTSVIMIGVFLWIWSSNIMILPDLSEKARKDLKRAMRIQSSTFVVAGITIIYFIGMAFGVW